MKNVNLFLAGVIAGLVGFFAARKTVKTPSFFDGEWWKDLESHSDHKENSAAQAVETSL